MKEAGEFSSTVFKAVREESEKCQSTEDLREVVRKLGTVAKVMLEFSFVTVHTLIQGMEGFEQVVDSGLEAIKLDIIKGERELREEEGEVVIANIVWGEGGENIGRS
jgi:hypothetical protein